MPTALDAWKMTSKFSAPKASAGPKRPSSSGMTWMIGSIRPEASLAVVSRKKTSAFSVVNVAGLIGRSKVTTKADAWGVPSAARVRFTGKGLSGSGGPPTGPIVLATILGPAAVTAGAIQMSTSESGVAGAMVFRLLDQTG